MIAEQGEKSDCVDDAVDGGTARARRGAPNEQLTCGERMVASEQRTHRGGGAE